MNGEEVDRVNLRDQDDAGTPLIVGVNFKFISKKIRYKLGKSGKLI